MSSRELMLLLSSFIRANNILVHKDFNDLLDLSRHDIAKIEQATVRPPTVDDGIFTEQSEVRGTGPKHDEPVIPKCFTRDNLRHKRGKTGSTIPYRVDQEDALSLPSELVCVPY